MMNTATNFSTAMMDYNLDMNSLDSVLNNIDDMLFTKIPSNAINRNMGPSSTENTFSSGIDCCSNTNSNSSTSNNNTPISSPDPFIQNNNIGCNNNNNLSNANNINNFTTNCNNINNNNFNQSYNNNCLFGIKSVNYNNGYNQQSQQYPPQCPQQSNNNNYNVSIYNKGKRYSMRAVQPKRAQTAQQTESQSRSYIYGGTNTNYGNNNRMASNMMDSKQDCYRSGNISIFEAGPEIKLQLKDYVFISKDCTNKLAQYLVKEEWGKSHALLYKYLDYIFRCQAFGKQCIIIKHCQTPKKFLLFNTGLQRKCDNQTLYALLIPNNIPNSQDWRVPFGPIENSFVSEDELRSKLKRCNMIIPENKIPQRTKFNTCLSDLLYDDAYSITVCLSLIKHIIHYP